MKRLRYVVLTILLLNMVSGGLLCPGMVNASNDSEIDGYPVGETNAIFHLEDNHPSDSADDSAAAQSINITETTYVTEIYIELRRNNNPTGDAWVSVYNTTGTHGVNATPTGTAIVNTSTVDVSTLDAVANILVKFPFDNAVELSPGTYIIAVHTPSSGHIDAGDHISTFLNTSVPVSKHDGNFAYYRNGGWTPVINYDMGFAVYGFTNNPSSYTFTDTYYENGTVYHPSVNVTASDSFTEEFNTTGGEVTQHYYPEPEVFTWEITPSLTRYIYSIGDENITVTIPETTAYSYGFNVKDYTGKLGLGDAHLEATRIINGTETIIERMKITQPNPTPLNLVYGKTYHMYIRFADGSRYDWGYFLAGSDDENTILIRETEWTDKSHMIYNNIKLEATRSPANTVTVQYNDTQSNTVWANITITERATGATVFTHNYSNDTWTLAYNSLNTSLGYIVSIEGEHGDFGEWGYVWIFDEEQTLPAAPSLTGIFDFGLGANLGGWILTIASVLGFSKLYRSRALLVGSSVASIITVLGFASYTRNQLIFFWFFSIVVALIGGRE